MSEIADFISIRQENFLFFLTLVYLHIKYKDNQLDFS